MQQRQRRGIARDAEEHRTAEGHQPEVADQQADAGRIEHVDGDLRHAPERQVRHQRQQAQHEQHRRDLAHGVP
jgi:hypothetical protein